MNITFNKNNINESVKEVLKNPIFKGIVSEKDVRHTHVGQDPTNRISDMEDKVHKKDETEI